MRFTILVNIYLLVVQSVTSISNQNVCFQKNEFNQQKIKIKKILHDEILRAGIVQRGCILGFVRRSFGSNDLWFTSPDHSPVPQFLKETSNINIINQGQSICFKLPNYSSRGRRKIQSTNKLIHRLPNLFHSKRKEFYQSVLRFYDNIAKKNC